MEKEFDVESLIGKEIKWNFNGREETAIVAGIAESVGWTLVRASNTDHELSCWNGPLSPVTKEDPDIDVEAFELAYPVVVEMLKRGYYDADQLHIDIDYNADAYGALSCAFK